MKIAVVANCQVVGIANSLRLLDPDLEIATYQVAQIPPSDRDAAADRASQADVIISQPLTESFGPLATEALASTSAELLPIPSIHFEGFHPDAIYIGDISARMNGPMSSYHSYLTVKGFLQGLSASEVITTFTHDEFFNLQYLQRWDLSRASLEARCAAIEFPISEVLDGWSCKSPFMLTFNHPTARVLTHVADIALRKLGKAGLAPAEWVAESIPADLTSAPVWPIYPSLARALGYAEYGSWMFRPQWPEQALTLKQFVEQSFHVYSQLDPSELIPRNPYVLADFRAEFQSQ